MSRRKFTKQFKEAAVKKLAQRSSLGEVARTSGVSVNVLNRWRQEFRNYGGKAFSGYGKRREPIKPRSHNIVFRLTEEEFDRLKAASLEVGSRSVSDFVRSQVLAATGEPSLVQLDKKLDELCDAVRQITRGLAKK
jgi:transposase-like protein